ncbi:1-deoxy-D-xylulose-5-phosphate synthase [Helicobacter japonicus]|uniref:1-deoxy-D-xylulose-5-phosphate synthase n=3 Tax=Helicobacter japonicus TaxID=425400 RepID=A0A4U8TNV0_9HELI|nr:1-deoxy-D-xylulose-5-phosphate synthase [Helicobacter japonicus]TLE02281.1 1-deoxy-D-xylulose-5-phosphate synthase [Helicobacter japonicus]
MTAEIYTYSHQSLSTFSVAQLDEIASRIRQRILEVVSSNGGHLSSTLGAVDLIVGMHAVFDVKQHPFIFDVSHQAYAHKLLTGRWETFDTLRCFGGISGFCNPKESVSDYFIAGHSSTSLSLAVGVGRARALGAKIQMPIVMIGDGSMSAGLVYEALNELGDKKYPMVIILNDNEMSIAKPIGAISNYLSQILTTPLYQKMRDGIKKMLTKMPDSATYLAKRFEESLKLITPGILFEELGLDYVGPIDGHNIELIITTLQKARDMNKPVIIHAQTLKGKGYEIAEGRFERWHGVGPFDIHTGSALKKASTISPTAVFTESLQKYLSDEKVVGVTAAMPSGTGLDKLIEKAPQRFIDVAICEAHAVTSMAAMAKEGFKPFVAIYSTFLQRAYDQIIHDVGILNLPVRFCIDRAGIVGEDGETHQGLFDIAYLRSIPNMVLFAPRDNESLRQAVDFAYHHNSSPCAFRYPRGKFVLNDGIFSTSAFVLGKAELLKKGKKLLLIGYGNGVGRAYEAYEELAKEGFKPSLLDLRFVKPLDKKTLAKLFSTHKYVCVFSDSYYMGGVGSAILEFMAEENIQNIAFKSFEIKDEFIPHGNSTMIESSLGLSTIDIVLAIKNWVDSK